MCIRDRFLLILMGYVLFRKNVFTNQTTQSLTVLLNKYIVFFVLLRSFQRPFDAHLGYALGVTFVCSMLFFLISLALANRVYRPEKTENYADCRVSVVLTNNGFMALPPVSYTHLDVYKRQVVDSCSS